MPSFAVYFFLTLLLLMFLALSGFSVFYAFTTPKAQLDQAKTAWYLYALRYYGIFFAVALVLAVWLSFVGVIAFLIFGGASAAIG